MPLYETDQSLDDFFGQFSGVQSAANSILPFPENQNYFDYGNCFSFTQGQDEPSNRKLLRARRRIFNLIVVPGGIQPWQSLLIPPDKCDSNRTLELHTNMDTTGQSHAYYVSIIISIPVVSLITFTGIR
jgi:hypothetical protein